jgi:hypothetical protein
MESQLNQVMTRYAGKDYLVIFPVDFETIDGEDAVVIHYENIIGEILVFNAIANRIGLLLGEKKNQLKMSETYLNWLGANLRKEFRTEQAKESTKKLTVQELDDMVLLDQRYRDQQVAVIILENELNKMEVLYWSCKSKQKSLEMLSAKLSPKEFELDNVRENAHKMELYGIKMREISGIIS